MLVQERVEQMEATNAYDWDYGDRPGCKLSSCDNHLVTSRAGGDGGGRLLMGGANGADNLPVSSYVII